MTEKIKRYECFDRKFITVEYSRDYTHEIEARTPEEAAECCAQVEDIKRGQKPVKSRVIMVRPVASYSEPFKEITVTVRWIPLYDAKK